MSKLNDKEQKPQFSNEEKDNSIIDLIDNQKKILNKMDKLIKLSTGILIFLGAFIIAFIILMCLTH